MAKEDKKGKTNPNGANQYLVDPRQLLCWEYYTDPQSDTFSNALQSALKAGYKKATANQITTFEWFVEKCRRMNLLGKAETVMDETLDTPHIVDAMGAFGPVIDPETGKPYQKVSTGILKIKTDVAKFVAETQGKAEGYSKRSELTGPNGSDLPSTITVLLDEPGRAKTE